MQTKSNVIIRVKFKGSKHSVTGYSSYNGNESYAVKYKNALLYARYIDYANEHHGRKMRYDTPLPSYKLISSAISSVRGYKKSPKGQNRQLNVEFRQEYEKKRETYKAKQKLEKQALKEQDRPISKKAYNKSLYGGKPMKEKQESIKQVSVSEREYNEFLKWKNRKKK